MRTHHRRPTRTRKLLIAACVLGVAGVGFGGVASAQTFHHRGHSGPQSRSQHADALGGTDSRRGWPGHGGFGSAPPATASPSPTASRPTGRPSTTPTTAKPTTSPSAVPTTTAPAGDSIIDQALAHINAARAKEGLPAYTLSAELSKASEAHNALMVGGCGLSHQCPGEASLGDRFSAAGVSWRSAGENIGQGNADNNAASILKAANGLTDLMLAEQAPNDGHRKNLLSSGFTRIGLAVTRGSDGRVWFTQDFVN